MDLYVLHVFDAFWVAPGWTPAGGFRLLWVLYEANGFTLVISATVSNMAHLLGWFAMISLLKQDDLPIIMLKYEGYFDIFDHGCLKTLWLFWFDANPMPHSRFCNRWRESWWCQAKSVSIVPWVLQDINCAFHGGWLQCGWRSQFAGKVMSVDYIKVSWMVWSCQPEVSDTKWFRSINQSRFVRYIQARAEPFGPSIWNLPDSQPIHLRSKKTHISHISVYIYIYSCYISIYVYMWYLITELTACVFTHIYIFICIYIQYIYIYIHIIKFHELLGFCDF